MASPWSAIATHEGRVYGGDLAIRITGAQDLWERLSRLGIWTARTSDWGREIAVYVQDALQRATDSWTHKPDFRIQTMSRSGTAATIRVTTDSQIFQWVNAGTRPHWIRARRAPVLAFPSQFRPKTTPGSLQSGPGFRGGPTVFRKAVWHPGTTARRFDEAAIGYAQKVGLPKLREELERQLAGRG